MFFTENKAIDTSLFIDAENHQIVAEVFVDEFEEPIISVAATPRELIQELIASGEYDEDKLDMLLDSLYGAVEILEKYLNAEDGDEF